MFPDFLRSALLVLAFLFLWMPSWPQRDRRPHDEHPDFGWSLRFGALKDKEKKKESRLPLSALPVAEPTTDEIRVDTDLVLNDFIVFDKKGAIVSGLKADDFEVREDDEPQKIEIFSNGSSYIPRSIFLVIDHSLSQWSYIEKSVEAAKVLVHSLGPADRMAIVSDDIEMLADLTSDKDILCKALDSLKTKALSGNFGKSQQYSSLFATLRERTDRNGTRQIVVFQTDGDEYSSIKAKVFPDNVYFQFKDIIEAAGRNGVTVYSVYTGKNMEGMSEKEKLGQTRNILTQERTAANLRAGNPNGVISTKFNSRYLQAKMLNLESEARSVAEIAEKTGGLAQNLERPDQARDIYSRILSDIDHRYVIGYYPTNQVRDGRRRELSVTVLKRSSMKVWGRTSYTPR